MSRWIPMGALAVLVLGAAGLRAQDEVRYFDREIKKDATIDGAIEEETALGLKIKVKAGSKLIAPADIHQITYKVKGLNAAEFRRPFGLESKALNATRP